MAEGNGVAVGERVIRRGMEQERDGREEGIEDLLLWVPRPAALVLGHFLA